MDVTGVPVENNYMMFTDIPLEINYMIFSFVPCEINNWLNVRLVSYLFSEIAKGVFTKDRLVARAVELIDSRLNHSEDTITRLFRTKFIDLDLFLPQVFLVGDLRVITPLVKLAYERKIKLAYYFTDSIRIGRRAITTFMLPYVDTEGDTLMWATIPAVANGLWKVLQLLLSNKHFPNTESDIDHLFYHAKPGSRCRELLYRYRNGDKFEPLPLPSPSKIAWYSRPTKMTKTSDV